MDSFLDYYKMKIDSDTDTIYFEKVKVEDIRIYGKTIDEIITILNGLDVERITGIKMTMENLCYLYKELQKREYEMQRENLKKMLNLE